MRSTTEPEGRPALTRAAILRAALELAEQEGLDGMTMRKVAAGLGVAPMALYHHLPNKEAMFDGILDLLIETADLPTGALDPEQWIREVARGMRLLARTHPNTFPLLLRRPVPLIDSSAARPFESGLAAFRRAGMEPTAAFFAVQAVSLALLPFGLIEAVTGADPDVEAGVRLPQLPPDEFPHLATLGSVAGTVDEYLDHLWSTAVEGLVQGLATVSRG